MKQEEYGDACCFLLLHNDAVEEVSACVCVLNYSRRRILPGAIVREGGSVFAVRTVQEAETSGLVLETIDVE